MPVTHIDKDKVTEADVKVTETTVIDDKDTGKLLPAPIEELKLSESNSTKNITTGG